MLPGDTVRRLDKMSCTLTGMTNPLTLPCATCTAWVRVSSVVPFGTTAFTWSFNMSSVNKLAGLIALIHGDRASTLAQLSEAFASDYGHFARSNNRDPLNAAVAALGRAPKDKALADAITDGYKAGALTVGYIGAQAGKFSAQPDAVRQSFEDAITASSAAFTAALEGSDAFADKTPKTLEEKAVAKTAKAEKAASVLDAAISAMVANGDLVRSDQIKTLADFGPLALVEALQGFADAGSISDVAMATLRAMVGYDALQAEHAALRAEHSDLRVGHAAVVLAHTKTRKGIKV